MKHFRIEAEPFLSFARKRLCLSLAGIQYFQIFEKKNQISQFQPKNGKSRSSAKYCCMIEIGEPKYVKSSSSHKNDDHTKLLSSFE